MGNSHAMLDTITALSHAFGTPDHVKGGGGNTSCKDRRTLWVKPSGTTLGSLHPDRFVAMDRQALQALYAADVPEDASAREARVKDLMAAAVLPGSKGRPSVEAPLHDVLEDTYVVHTHSVLVNGLTCARDGEAAAGDLFPSALWIPYIDPGYTLCMEVRKRVRAASGEEGRQPRVLLLDNHGVFVQGEGAHEIETTYGRMLRALEECYEAAGVATTLQRAEPAPEVETTAVADTLRDLLGPDPVHVVYGGRFDVSEGPITPDHIVYAKAFPLVGEPGAVAIAAFKEQHGYAPLVYATEAGVFTVGPTEARARLTLDLAEDAALLKQLARAFGDIEFLDDRQRTFIENWEVESYRQKQMAG